MGRRKTPWQTFGCKWGAGNSRDSVHVSLCDKMSASPDCSAVKRSFDVKGVYSTFSASPNRAAAKARHTSTSNPVHLPFLSTRENPSR